MERIKLDKTTVSNIKNIGILDPAGENHNPLNNLPYSERYRKLSTFWRKLPVYEKVHDIINMINATNVLLLISATGSGKSILMPRIVHHTTNYKGNIIMTLPRQIITKSSAIFGSELMDVTLGNEVGYQYKGSPIGSKSDKTQILYMTDGTLTAMLNRDPLLSEYSAIIIDEAHEMSINIVLLLYLLRETLKKRPELKLIIMSATVDTNIFSSYFRDFKFGIVDVGGGRTFPIESNFIAHSLNYKSSLDAGFKTLVQILEEDDPTTVQAHDIVFFVTSSNEAFLLCKQLHEYIKIEKDNNKCKITCHGEVYCVELYANMKLDKQILAQDREEYKKDSIYNRKVVIATNVAESSLTIDGIKYVIDIGYELSSSFDPIDRARKLDRQLISQAQAKQRMGRSGRTEPGICYHMYTKNTFDNEMIKYPEPEIKTSDISYECLRLLANENINTVDKLTAVLTDLIESPKEAYINCAINNLIQLGAIEKGNITKLGKIINDIPDNNLFMATAIIYGKIYNCSKEIMKISAIIEACKGNINELYNVPTNVNGDKNVYSLMKKYENAKRKFANNSGDHLSLLSVFEKFEIIYTKNKNDANKLGKWAYDRFLKLNVLIKAMQNYKLKKHQIKKVGKIDGLLYGINVDDSIMELNLCDKILICLLIGFRLNTGVRKVGDSIYNTQYVTNKNIRISKSSFILYKTKLPVHIFYHELFISMGKSELGIVSHISKKAIKMLS